MCRYEGLKINYMRIDMKTVCVSTYCEWSSYGSIMQAIGLKKKLSNLGFESFIVRDKPAPQEQRTFRIDLRFGLRGVWREICNLPNRGKMRRYYAATLELSLSSLNLEDASYNLVKKHYSDELLSKRVRFLEKCEHVGFMEAVKKHKLKSSAWFRLKYLIKKLIGGA